MIMQSLYIQHRLFQYNIDESYLYLPYTPLPLIMLTSPSTR